MMVKSIRGWDESARAKNLSFLCRKIERDLFLTVSRFYREREQLYKVIESIKLV